MIWALGALLTLIPQTTETSSVPQFAPVLVKAERTEPLVVEISEHDLRRIPATNIGEVLTVMGVTGVRRAASAIDPVLRGTGGERIRTQVGGVPIFGACPSRMDPPVTYFGPLIVNRVAVRRGMPSVTEGPVGYGGSIELSLDYERASATPELTPFLSAFYDSARTGLRTGGGVRGGNAWGDVLAAADWSRMKSYQSADDRTVPANQRLVGGNLSLAFRPFEDHRFWNTMQVKRDWDIEYPALPMDNRRTTFWLYNGGYRITDLNETVEQIELRGGFALVDHLMDNRDKANRGKLEASTPASSRSWAGGAKARLMLSEGLKLTAGFDASLLERDAIRTRKIVASGRMFADHIWPDARQIDLGLFTELNWSPKPELSLSLGLRWDLVFSSAAGVDDKGMGQPIRNHYASYYGRSAEEIDRTEPLGAVRFIGEWDADALTPFAGFGFGMRPAGVTERYFAFGPAPGGYLVGHPGLRAEKRFGLDMGTRYRYGWFQTEVAIFGQWVRDFILQTGIDQKDVNGDGAADLIRGFRNINARYLGGEVSAEAQPLRFLSLFAAVSYVLGHNTSDGRDLPEIPPLEGRIRIRVDEGSSAPWWWGAVGARIAASQNLVDATYPENSTPGFTTLWLQAGVSLWDPEIHLVLGIENLLDADYHEHLTREALFNSGGLSAGDEVPSPGRHLFLTLHAAI